MALVVAIVLVIVGDRFLRTRQNLIVLLLGHELPVLVPLSEQLKDYADKKTQWNQLRTTLAASGSDGPAAKDRFVKTTYELAKFTESELSAEDRRRRQILLDLVQRYPDAPESSDAYWALFNPAWQKDLSGSYPQFAAALTKLAEARPQRDAVSELERLAAILRERQQKQLEIDALRRVRKLGSVTVSTDNSMRRLAQLLDSSDPDRPSLEQELETYADRRERLTASAKWYAQFEKTRSAGRLADVETLRREAPSKPEVDPFVASADAHLVDSYLAIGRLADADRLRQEIAAREPVSADEATALIMELSASMQPPGQPRNPTPVQPMLPAPDMMGIQMHRWRGLLLAGQFDRADAAAQTIFVDDLKPMLAQVAEEKLAVQGQAQQLSPSLVLERRTSGLPSEFSGSSDAWYGRFELLPIGKAVPAEIKSSAEMWVSGDRVLIVFDALDPRAELPAPKATERDKEVFKDECVELFFAPDRWFDSYLQIDVNRAGALFDARLWNTGSIAKRQYRPDPSLNLDVSTKSEPIAGGWRVRVLLPRAQLFPPERSTIKFNVRRFRFVQEQNQPVLQIYSWSTVAPGNEHKPDQFGWVVLPK